MLFTPKLLVKATLCKILQNITGAVEPRGQGGQLPPQFFGKIARFSLKLYENTANYNTWPPQILSFQYIAPLILRASAGPEICIM